MPPSAAFEQYHDQQPLILPREDYTIWLDSPRAAQELFTAAAPAGLIAEKAAV